MGHENLVEINENVVKSTINYEPKHNSFVELLFGVLKKCNNRIVLVDNDSGQQWSANSLLDAIVTLGIRLSQIGISKGDFVAFLCPNSDVHTITLLSVWAIGAIYTGLVHKSPLRELSNLIRKTNATFLIGSKETVSVCREFMSSNNVIKKFFLIDETNDANVISIQSLMKMKASEEEKKSFFHLMSTVTLNDLCKISFSSGTTGEPKPVMEAHSLYVSYSRFTAREVGIVTENDKCALFQPLPHGGGTMIMALALACGASVILFSRFDSKTFIKDVQKHSITFAFIVPAFINLLNRTYSKPLDSFCLKKVLTGGEFAPPLICKEFIRKFRPQYFAQCYAATEGGWATFVPFSEGITNLTSVGIPTPGYQIKIINYETGKKVGANETGEIYMEGPERSAGYLNNIDATREAFDEESFFKTGDIGYFDQMGYVYIIDRIKEIIKFNSLQVSPTELQCILLQHESVKEAAVVGIPDEIQREIPKAYVVLKDLFKYKVNEKELIEFVNSQVTDIKKLRGGVQFMAELPKTSLGKIDRATLKTL